MLAWCLISLGTFIIGSEVCLSSRKGDCLVTFSDYRACAENLIPLAVKVVCFLLINLRQRLIS